MQAPRLTLSFQETGNPISLIAWNVRQHGLRTGHISTHDSRLVLDHRQGQRVRKDVHILVGDVDSVVGGQVAEQVDALIKVVDDV